jgi:predicted RNA polymerase sigma factor
MLRPGPYHLQAAIAACHAEAPRWLAHHHLLHATRAALLRDLGRLEEARDADRHALELTDNPPSDRFSNSGWRRTDVQSGS